MASPALSRILLALVLVALVVSGLAPKDSFTWFLEIVPVLLAVPILVATRKRFPLTRTASVLLTLHALILMVGGHWTYAEVPFGFWLRDTIHLTRNPYDRIGHFAQGFVPAILAREILYRRSPLRGYTRWTFFLVTCVCLAFSAAYELFEWSMAEATGTAADAFLGSQGDKWDTQWDMFTALIGAVTAQLTIARWHDRELERMT